MYFRSSSGSHEHSEGTRKNFSHRMTHIKPADPVSINETRQPSFDNNHATSGAENAGPANVPALKIAVASPRSLTGNHCLTTFPEVGKEAASPAPRASLVASIPPNVVETPVSIPDIDQIVTDKPLTNRVPMRSIIQPQGRRKKQ